MSTNQLQNGQSIYGSMFDSYRTTSAGAGIMAVNQSMVIARDITTKYGEGVLSKHVYQEIEKLTAPLMNWKTVAGDFGAASEEKEGVLFALDNQYAHQVKQTRTASMTRLEDKLKTQLALNNTVTVMMQRLLASGHLNNLVQQGAVTQQDIYALEQLGNETKQMVQEFVLLTEVGNIEERELTLMANLIRKLDDLYVRQGHNDIWQLRNLLGANIHKTTNSNIIMGQEGNGGVYANVTPNAMPLFTTPGMNNQMIMVPPQNVMQTGGVQSMFLAPNQSVQQQQLQPMMIQQQPNVYVPNMQFQAPQTMFPQQQMVQQVNPGMMMLPPTNLYAGNPMYQQQQMVQQPQQYYVAAPAGTGSIFKTGVTGLY